MSEGMLISTKHTRKSSTTSSSKKKRSTKKVSAMMFEGDEGIRTELNKQASKIYRARKTEKAAKKDIAGSRTTILTLMKQLKRKEKIHFEGMKYIIDINETIRTHISAIRMISFFNRKGDVGKKHLKKLIRMGAVSFNKKMLEVYCEMNNIALPKGYLVDEEPIVNVDVEQVLK